MIKKRVEHKYEYYNIYKVDLQDKWKYEIYDIHTGIRDFLYVMKETEGGLTVEKLVNNMEAKKQCTFNDKYTVDRYV